MTEPVDIRNIGLRGVIVADTRISLVDGVRGRLLYRGYPIRDLAARASYEEVVYLLLMGRLPTAEELEVTCALLAEARPLPEPVRECLRSRNPQAHTMDVLQGTVAALTDHDPDLGRAERPAMVRSALRLIARMASVMAAWAHIRRGSSPPEVAEQPSHAAAFLAALWGRPPTADEARLMDTLLVLHAEHTFNASTFSAREVASTRAHMYAAVGAAVGALGGALHGGANARVMEMLLEIGTLERVEPWVRRRLASGQRVMGLGHAVYRTEDPRATILREVAQATLAGRPEETWLNLARKVERVSRRLLKETKGLDLYPNVDFYSGPILYALGLPTEMFPAFFAASRVAGWCAHVIEEQLAEAQPRAALYRPASHYAGRYCGPQGCRFIPLEDRGAGCPCGHDFRGCTELESIAELDALARQDEEARADDADPPRS
jgi:citrate synthase